MRGSLVSRRLAGALLAVSFLLVFVVALSGCGSGATKSVWGNPLPRDGADGTPAPAFSGVTLDGKTLTLDQYRGKPLLLVYMTGT